MADVMEEKKPTSPAGDWVKTKIGKPLFWVGIGFVACKILDVYLEGQKTRRIRS